VIICEIILHWLVIIQNNKRCTVQVLKYFVVIFFVFMSLNCNDLIVYHSCTDVGNNVNRIVPLELLNGCDVTLVRPCSSIAVPVGWEPSWWEPRRTDTLVALPGVSTVTLTLQNVLSKLVAPNKAIHLRRSQREETVLRCLNARKKSIVKLSLPKTTLPRG